MNSDDFEGWRSDKKLALTRINNALSEMEVQPIGGSLEYLEHMTERRREPEYKDAADELRDILKDMCRVYLTSTPIQQVDIRDLLTGKVCVLFHLREYQMKTTEKTPSADDVEWFLLALAAVSMEGRAIDYRDTYPLLGELYIRAAQGGSDPSPYFAQVASMSSREKNLFGGVSVSEVIGGFEDKESGLYKQLVEPFL
jgi:hypothetical protein